MTPGTRGICNSKLLRNLLHCAVMLLMVSGQAYAFGEEGHRIIAALAAEQLTPSTKQQIAQLLAGEEEPTLPGISFWADEHKNRYTAPMHYVNMPAGQCQYKANRDCPEDRCVVAAIGKYRLALSDPSAASGARATALKMVVHLVGDAHQPLHAGLAEDRGGNLFQLQWDGRGSNLHRLWDSQLIQASDPDWMTYAKSLQRGVGSGATQSIPSQWVEESCALINTPAFYPLGRKPGSEYLDRWKATLDMQMQRAGQRLASLLNEALRGPRSN